MSLSRIAKNEICKALAFIPDKPYLYIKYFFHTRKILHLNPPITFNEKLQWLKLYNRDPLYSKLVDKYEVRSFIKEKIGECYLIPVIDCWESADEILEENLPKQFVLKCTHDSGSVIICKDKDCFNIEESKRFFRKALKENMYNNGREWPYKDVKPRIIAEKYMEDPETKELRDYKFFCFNGKVKMFKIDYDRFKSHHANYYDEHKELLPFDEVMCPRDLEQKIVLPDTIDKMMYLAECIASELPFARVDFYDVSGHVYFGEITFFPTSGFGTYEPEEWDKHIGEWLKLPSKIGK